MVGKFGIQIPLRKTLVAFDRDPPFEAYVDGDWTRVPYFTKTEAMRVMRYYNGSGAGESVRLRYDPKKDAFIEYDLNDPSSMLVYEGKTLPTENGPRKLYHIDWDFWDEYKGKKKPVTKKASVKKPATKRRV